jgi:hypothetical protein
MGQKAVQLDGLAKVAGRVQQPLDGLLALDGLVSVERSRLVLFLLVGEAAVILETLKQTCEIFYPGQTSSDNEYQSGAG